MVNLKRKREMRRGSPNKQDTSLTLSLFCYSSWQACALATWGLYKKMGLLDSISAKTAF